MVSGSFIGRGTILFLDKFGIIFMFESTRYNAWDNVMLSCY